MLFCWRCPGTPSMTPACHRTRMSGVYHPLRVSTSASPLWFHKRLSVSVNFLHPCFPSTHQPQGRSLVLCMSSSRCKAHKWSLSGEKWAKAAACHSHGMCMAAECHWWSALSLALCGWLTLPSPFPIPSPFLNILSHTALWLQETDCKTVIARVMYSATAWFWGQQISPIHSLTSL